MGRLLRIFSATALVAIATGTARSQDSTCKFVQWGFSYYRFEQSGETWTYLLNSSGPHWRNIPYGYHAPGALVLGPEDPGGTGGLYYFGVQSHLVAETASERAERRKEWAGYYPPTLLGPEHLEYRGSREGIALGPFAGYAILFGIIAKERWPKGSWQDRVLARSDGVLALHLTDRCIMFETTMLLEASSGPVPWAPLDSLSKEITIEKGRGAQTVPIPKGPYNRAVTGNPYSAIVKGKSE